jgi:hypothetical protein
MRVLFTAALALVVGCAAPAVSTSPTPTSSTITSRPSATAAPTATAGPSVYTSVPFAYRIELPAGWRYSQCQSGEDIGPVASQHEGFTSASVDDEASGHTGPLQPVVSVRIVENPAGRTALQWLSDGGVGFGDTFDRAIVDGREGAQVITATREITTLVTAARGRIYAIAAFAPQGITADARRIMNSLHVLDDTELTAARAALPSASPTAPRSPEFVADTLARGFSQKDASVLATVAWACISRGAQNAGAGFRSATRELDDIRKAFAAGLSVTVTPRPVTVQAGGYGGIESTWTEPGQAPRRAALNFLKRGETWYWFQVILLN